METKKEIFKRVPPGDRWMEIGKDDRVYVSLTEALEHHFQQYGTRQFYIDAGTGTISKVEDIPEPTPVIKQFSIYGDY